MFSSRNSNPSAAITKAKQKETTRYLKRIQHKAPSPFYLACEKGDLVYVEEKLKILSFDELDQIESTGETALHIATRNNRLEIVRLLIQSGCSQSIYNSAGELPYEEAQTDEMRQLYAPPSSSHFFEENLKDSYGVFKPLMLIGKPPESNTLESQQTTAAGDIDEDKNKSLRNQEFKSEEEVIQYLTNRQALAMWIKICAWVYRRFGGIIGRREEEGNDFAPELFDLENDRDLEEFFNSLPPTNTQPTIITKESSKKDGEEEKTWRQRFTTACCCKNATAPAPQPSHLTTTESFITAQPKDDHPESLFLQRMPKQLLSSHNPRDFIRASKQLDSVTPLIYLYTNKNLPFYAALNKKLAVIDSNPNGTASLCDRFIREFDLREAELSRFGFTGETYRGTSMSPSDVAYYRKVSEQNPKWFMAPRSFQSTSMKRSKAMEFVHMKKGKGKDVGLMVFHMPVACSTIFAVKEISAFPAEEEVLIIPGNLFTIMKVTQCQDDPTLPEVHLEHVKRDISFFKKLRTIYRAATTSASGVD